MSFIEKYGGILTAFLLGIAMIGFVLAKDADYPVDISSRIISVPEFSSVFFPVALISGFLGAVLLIKQMQEH